MKLALPILLLMVSGCAAVTPPQPALKSLSGNAVIPPATHHLDFAWNYSEPMPADNIAFDLEGSIDLAAWYLIATTNQPPVGYDSFQPVEFFRLGAHFINP